MDQFEDNCSLKAHCLFKCSSTDEWIKKVFMYIYVLCLVAQSYPTLCNPMDCVQPIRFLCPWGFSRQDYQSGLPVLPNPGLPHCRWILDHLSHQGTIYIRQLCLFKSLISLTSVLWFSVYKSCIFSFKKFLCCCEWNYFSFILKLLLVHRNIVHICTSIFFFSLFLIH